MKNIILGTSITSFNILLFNAIAFYLPLHLNSIPFNGFEIGLIMAFFYLAGFFATPFSGFLSDKLNIKFIFFLGLALLFTCYFIFSLSINFYMALLAYSLGGLGYYLIDVASNTLILKSTSEDKSGKELGKVMVIKFLSLVLGLFLGGFMLKIIDFKLFFLIIALLYLLLAYPIVKVESLELSKFSFKEYLKDLSSRSVIIFSLIIFLFGLHWGVEATSYSLFLKQKYNLNMGGLSIFMAIPIVFLAIASLISGNLLDKFKNIFPVMSMGMFLSGFGFILFVMVDGKNYSLFWRIIHEIGDGIFSTTLYYGTTKFFQKKRMGGNFGVISSVMVITSVIGAIIFGPIGKAFNYSVPHVIAGTLSVVSGMLFFFLYRRILSTSILTPVKSA